MDYVKQIEQYKQENEKLKAERDFLSKENQKINDPPPVEAGVCRKADPD